jgi:nitrite reductase/ring-hydroxylating ferredoxin subunit
MAKIKIGPVKDLTYSPMKEVQVAGKEILVVKLGETFTAIGNKCTHMGCKLSKGKLDGETVICPCHRSVFNARTGELVKGPAKTPEPAYNVTVENGELFMEL